MALVLLSAAAVGTCALLYANSTPKLATNNPWLKGNFGPVDKEIVAEELQVEGTIPPEVNGIFVRNGPNPQFTPFEGHHWFEGDGMLHSITINAGKASYRNKFIETTAYLKEKKAGTALYYPFFIIKGVSGLATFLFDQFRSKFVGYSRFGRSTSNTSMTFHHGRFLTLMEAEAPYLVHSPTLKTKGHYDFGGALKHGFTAHPKIDPDTGEMFFFSYQSFKTPYIQYAVVDKKGNKGESIALDIPFPIMMHDFAITKNYAIFFDLPLIFYKDNVLKNKPAYEFTPKPGNSRFGILPRYSKNGGEIKWFNVTPCYIFHSANAWEENDKIVVVAVRRKDIDLSGLDNTTSEYTLYRWELNLTSGQVTEIPLPHAPPQVEFPTINENFTGKKNRFVYCVNTLYSSLHKYDLELQQCSKVEWASTMCSEMVFIPRHEFSSEPNSEDDGWIMGFIYDNATEKSSAVIIDAKDLSVKARIHVPQRVPQGFHARWLTKTMLAEEITTQ